MKLFGKPAQVAAVHGISVRLPEMIATKPLELIEKIVAVNSDPSVCRAALHAIAIIYKIPDVRISNCHVELK